jgi:hypothetical protein
MGRHYQSSLQITRLVAFFKVQAFHLLLHNTCKYADVLFSVPIDSPGSAREPKTQIGLGAANNV